MNKSKANTLGATDKNIADDGDAALSPPEGNDYRLDALNRILSCGHFRASERNKQFLKFVVEETVAGRASRIKAFTVAVDVFGRDSSFDASVDPIVRIAAGHLRRSLEEYYSGQGRRDPVRIILPLGTYAPVFIPQEGFPRRAFTYIQRMAVQRQKSLQSGAVSITMALAGAALGTAYLVGSFESGTVETPVVVVDKVQPYPAEDSAAAMADIFTQSLWIALSGDQSFRVVGVKAGETLEQVMGRVDKTFGHSMPLYQLLSTVQREGNELRVYWHVLDGRSNESYLSASASRDIETQAESATPGQLAQEVAASLKQFSTDATHEARD